MPPSALERVALSIVALKATGLGAAHFSRGSIAASRDPSHTATGGHVHLDTARCG